MNRLQWRNAAARYVEISVMMMMMMMKLLEGEREFICQINKQIKQIQISTVAGYQ